jgi:hypothetical protein
MRWSTLFIFEVLLQILTRGSLVFSLEVYQDFIWTDTISLAFQRKFPLSLKALSRRSATKSCRLLLDRL